METKEHEVAERLEAAATLLERAVAWLEERQTALCGQVEKISATVEQTRREEKLEQKLAAAEQEIAELKATAEQAAAEHARPMAPAPSPVRRTVPAPTTEMLAKHGIGEGPVDVRTVDAALKGLSLEQRIAVKSQLLRAGAIG
jgi:F0F1-type ATP synthase membrane subunit b/b'